MYRDVGAFVDGSADAEGVVEVAVNACALTGAHLTVIGAPRDPGHVMHLAQASGAVLAKAVADSQGAANAMAARIEHAASERGVSCLHHTIRAPSVDMPDLVARIARRFDFSVMALPGPDARGEAMALFEAALFHSGRALIGAPRGIDAPRAFDRVLVAWDGHREAARAVGDAMPFLKAAKSVEVFSVSSRPGELDDELPWSNIAGHLARHGVNCEQHAVDARGSVADLLLGRAEATRADLIVMGAYRHSRWRQALLGGATTSILQRTRAPLFLSR